MNRVVEIFWSKEAWAEVFRNYSHKNNTHCSELFQQSMIKNAIDLYSECMVTIKTYKNIGIHDKDDEHILAATIQAQASYLLTNDEILLNEVLPRSYKIIISKPDDFLVDEVLLRMPNAVFDAAESHRKSLTRSNPSREQYTESLNRSGLKRFSKKLDQIQ